SIVDQREDALYMRLGSFFGILVGVVAQTNGLPEYILGDSTTKANLIANNFSDPNQVFRCRVKFVKMTTSNFLITTRQLQDPVNPDTTDFIVSNITNKAAYTLQLDPLKNKVLMAKYPTDSLAVLDVGGNSWVVFGETDFTFSTGTWYWAKFYLYEKIVKAKVWAGNFEDEPSEWLLEAQDDSVWTRGKYSTFIMSGLPPSPPDNGDIVMIDDVVVEGFGDVTAVDSGPENMPGTFELHQNYPNPFNPETVISYNLQTSSHVTLSVYNLMGQRIVTLVDKQRAAGQYKHTWNGRDAAGDNLASGVYIYRLHAGGQMLTRKMLLVR
ncbi:MAG: T9SS type A sorting domain-containing protein, partial [bacterium]